MDESRGQVTRFVDELRQAGDDFDQFVSQQLDHLESLQATIVDREQKLESDRAELRRQLDSLQQAQQRLDAASAAAESAAKKWLANSQLEAEAPAPADHGQPLTKVIAELQSERTRLGEVLAANQAHAEAQFHALAQSATAELAQARSDLQAASEELSRERQRFAEESAALILAAATRPAPVEVEPAPITTPEPEAAKSEPAPAQSPVAQSIEPAPVEPAIVAAPAPSGTDVKPAPASDGGAGWWGELQELRRGLSKGNAKSPDHRVNGAAARTNAGEERVLGKILNDCQAIQGELSAHAARSTPSK